jgi:hypothetical protein
MTRSKMQSSSSAASMGFSGWLTLLFIGLKLTGYITWPWIWVLSPIWISLAIFVVAVLIFAIYVVITGK